MLMLDRDIADCHALVIDGNPTSRSLLAAQLRDFGVAHIAQASKVPDARRQLECREFDIVLCEQHFAAGVTGNDLLDDLRRANLLPYKTVFIMVTGEADYTKVAEAAESALDGYLLKPHTASALAERVRQARSRKRALKDIFDAIEAQRHDDAARLCLLRFRERAPYWLYAARIGAELLLRLGRHDGAQQLYEAVIATKALPWARLGVARAQLDANQPQQARRTLDTLIADEPGFADAWDVMGRVQIEQGQLDEALATFRQASALTPGSLARLQKQGMLAFYAGDLEESARALDRAAAMGISSTLFDHQSLLLLAFARFAQRDAKGLQRCIDNLRHALDKTPDDARLARLLRLARVLDAMLDKQLATVVADVRELAAQTHDDGFDFEAGANLLALLARLSAAEVQLPEADSWVDAVAQRFCTSKGLAELLARAADAHPAHAQRVRDVHQQLGVLTEQAMAHTLAGDPSTTVTTLLVHARRTLNGRLIETARLTLQRHRDKVADADALGTELEALRMRHAPPSVALGNAQARQSGGVSLRAASPAADSLRTAPPAPQAAA